MQQYMAQMNLFLKRDQTLALKSLETTTEKHLRLVSSKTVGPQLSFFFLFFSNHFILFYFFQFKIYLFRAFP